MKKNYKINEVATLTQIAPSALRFWEEKKLLNCVREENGYREYSLSDLLQIVEIKMYRELGLSLEEIKQLAKSSPQQVLENTRCLAKKMEAELEKLKMTQNKLMVHQQRLEEYIKNKDKGWQVSSPDLTMLAVEKIDATSLKITAEDLYDACTYAGENTNFVCCLALPQGKDILWTKDENKWRYIQGYLSCGNNQLPDNELSLIKKSLLEKEEKVHAFILRYFCSFQENGKQVDCYKLWVELYPKREEK